MSKTNLLTDKLICIIERPAARIREFTEFILKHDKEKDREKLIETIINLSTSSNYSHVTQILGFFEWLSAIQSKEEKEWDFLIKVVNHEIENIIEKNCLRILDSIKMKGSYSGPEYNLMLKIFSLIERYNLKTTMALKFPAKVEALLQLKKKSMRGQINQRIGEVNPAESFVLQRIIDLEKRKKRYPRPK
jgi:hypothetical protein